MCSTSSEVLEHKYINMYLCVSPSERNRGSNNIVNAHKFLLGKDYEDMEIIWLVKRTKSRQLMSHVMSAFEFIQLFKKGNSERELEEKIIISD
jgi:hypothetical protein